MKKGSHKNQIIITTLALLLAVVGYDELVGRGLLLGLRDDRECGAAVFSGDLVTFVPLMGYRGCHLLARTWSRGFC